VKKVSNFHAEVWAPALLWTPERRVALLEMVGPRSAVKSIWASLTSEGSVHVDEDGERTWLGGMPPYRRLAAPIRDIRQVHALVYADKRPDSEWTVAVRRGEVPRGILLLQALRDDPRLPLPLVPEWADALWEEAVAARLAHPLRGYGPYTGIVYNADLDDWVGLLDRLLREGRITIPDEVKEVVR